MQILFLCKVMAPGFGVSVVVTEMARHLAAWGHRIVVGCEILKPGTPRLPGCETLRVPATAQDVLDMVRQHGIDVVVAHTSPYFEVLPALRDRVAVIAWEHGEPPPPLFNDAAARQAVADHKRAHVYPRVDRVVAISAFIRHDIEWSDATIVPNGCDHMPDVGPKPFDATHFHPGRRLRIGTLMRLGKGEALYKGNPLFLQLSQACRQAKWPVDFEVMGRGSPQDAQTLRDAGLVVHLNASDAQRAEYLRGLDVFISCSLWEGFNLPLAEAAAVGTAALALDTGAHPEVTPLLASNLQEVLSLIRRYTEHRALLRDHGTMCLSFVRSKYQWQNTAASLLSIYQSLPRQRREAGQVFASASPNVPWHRRLRAWCRRVTRR